MKKIGIVLALLPILAACYTTNDVFAPDPSLLFKPSHELTASTTLPFIALPQNIGLNYRFSTPLSVGSNWQLNAFARYEHGRKVIANYESGGFDSGTSAYAERFKSDNAKVMLMPSYHFNDELQLGLGVGLEYLDFVNAPAGTSAIFLPMFNLNLGKVTRNDEVINSWNFGFSISDRWNPEAGVGHAFYYNQYDSTMHHFFTDAGSSTIWKSFKCSFTHEKKIANSPGISLLFRLDMGISIIRDAGKSFSKTLDKEQYPVYQYDSYRGVNFPLVFSMGLKF